MAICVLPESSVMMQVLWKFEAWRCLVFIAGTVPLYGISRLVMYLLVVGLEKHFVARGALYYVVGLRVRHFCDASLLPGHLSAKQFMTECIQLGRRVSCVLCAEMATKDAVCGILYGPLCWAIPAVYQSDWGPRSHRCVLDHYEDSLLHPAGLLCQCPQDAVCQAHEQPLLQGLLL